MKRKKIRPLGDVTQDLEKVLTEMSFSHDLQHGEVIALVHAWLQIHAPSQREEYILGGNPILYYGPEK